MLTKLIKILVQGSRQSGFLGHCHCSVHSFLLGALCGLRFLELLLILMCSFLATIDVKRNIFDLCTDSKDCYLAVIEVIMFLSSKKCVSIYYMIILDKLNSLGQLFCICNMDGDDWMGGVAACQCAQYAS